MLTEGIGSGIAESFITAPKESYFGKIFRENMDKNDKNSFNDDIKKQIGLAISNSKTALYRGQIIANDEMEYRNCTVKNK